MNETVSCKVYRTALWLASAAFCVAAYLGLRDGDSPWLSGLSVLWFWLALWQIHEVWWPRRIAEDSDEQPQASPAGESGTKD